MRTELALAVGCSLTLAAGTPCWAADSGLNLSLHANSRATAADVGLPPYPSATLDEGPKPKGGDKDQDMDDDDKDDDASTDIGFSFGDFKFGLKRVAFVTSDSPEKVLAFYRPALAKYGEVLECDHGKTVGKAPSTGGLKCEGEKSHLQINGYSSTDAHELRVGSAHHFRVVGIEDSKAGSTRFEIAVVTLPKD